MYPPAQCTPAGVQFDEVGYVACLRQQEADYQYRVNHFTKSLGPPRHFLCGGVGVCMIYSQLEEFVGVFCELINFVETLGKTSKN